MKKMYDVLDRNGHIFFPKGIEIAAARASDDESLALFEDYLEALESLAKGDMDRAADFALELVHTLLKIEIRLREDDALRAA